MQNDGFQKINDFSAISHDALACLSQLWITSWQMDWIAQVLWHSSVNKWLDLSFVTWCWWTILGNRLKPISDCTWNLTRNYFSLFLGACWANAIVPSIGSLLKTLLSSINVKLVHLESFYSLSISKQEMNTSSPNNFHLLLLCASYYFIRTGGKHVLSSNVTFRSCGFQLL